MILVYAFACLAISNFSAFLLLLHRVADFVMEIILIVYSVSWLFVFSILVAACSVANDSTFGDTNPCMCNGGNNDIDCNTDADCNTAGYSGGTCSNVVNPGDGCGDDNFWCSGDMARSDSLYTVLL